MVQPHDVLQRLDGPAAGVALRLFMDQAFASLLSTTVGQTQWEKLLDVLEPKLTSNTDRELMAAVRSFTGTPDQLHLDSRIKKLAAMR